MMKTQALARRYLVGLSLILIPIFLFCGCKQKVSWIHVAQKSVELNAVGETFPLTYAPLDKENKPVPGAVLTWTSSHPDVVTVDNNGVLSAVGSGDSTVTVTSVEGEKAVVQVKVSILGSIVITPAELELAVGQKQELEATVLNEKGEPFEDQHVGWATSDDSIIFIDDLGGITAVAPGEATITATLPGKATGHGYGTAKVTVKAPEESAQ
ncbi:MAG: Ig domain-containing protein [Deltaproteobacteria bacterium]|nr:Ig domain-containing protein [Deltaproteobacteria bacterium]